MIICGDALTTIHGLAAHSIQCVVTSPPYYGLRDYGHASQLGQEDAEEAYVVNLVNVCEQLKAVLHPTGVFWLNMGDTYGPTGLRCLPWRVALALKHSGWCLRSDVIWSKTRWMPNGGSSRPIMVHEYLFMLTLTNKGYYYNPDAIREPHSPVSLKRWASSPVAALGASQSMGYKQADREGYRTKKVIPHPLGKLKTSVWQICPSNYRGAHFAVFPEKLVEPCILSCSREGDMVLDPFCGSGTVGAVAKRYKRQFIGIDINPDYVALAVGRIASCANHFKVKATITR